MNKKTRQIVVECCNNGILDLSNIVLSGMDFRGAHIEGSHFKNVEDILWRTLEERTW